MTYLVAYRNTYTKFDWVEIFITNNDMPAVIASANKLIADNMKNSEIGIFAMPEGASYWKNRTPRMILNKQGDPRKISSSIGGVINSFYKPGNNSIR